MTSSMASLDALFSPASVGNLRVKNRIVYPATGSGFATEEGHVTERLVSYFEDRAKGGAGIVFTSGTAPDYLNRANRKVIGAWDNRFIKGLSASAL